MSTLTRAETPTQSPSVELNRAGTAARVGFATGASLSRDCRYSSAGESSVKITSAGECEPSATIWLASAPSSSERTFTWMPVAFSNPSTSASVVCWCWPL